MAGVTGFELTHSRSNPVSGVHIAKSGNILVFQRCKGSPAALAKRASTGRFEIKGRKFSPEHMSSALLAEADIRANMPGGPIRARSLFRSDQVPLGRRHINPRSAPRQRPARRNGPPPRSRQATRSPSRSRPSECARTARAAPGRSLSALLVPSAPAYRPGSTARPSSPSRQNGRGSPPSSQTASPALTK